MKKVKLGDYVNIKTGKLNANVSNENGKYPFFTCGKEILSIDSYSFDEECVLLAGNGDFSTKYYNGKFDAYQRTYIITPKDNYVNCKYIYYVVTSKIDELKSLGQGSVIKYLKLNQIKNIEFNLPSIEEQERIVQILDQVYENIGWDIQDKIKDLKELKKSAIDKAIRGLLTTQNENESAEELYKSIQEEKEKLIKEGKIKKSKKDEIKPISKDEIPFEIPSNWKWCRLGDICRLITDGTHSTPKYTEYGVPFISVKDISNGFIDFSNTKYISMEEHQSLIKRCNPELKDILLTKIGTTGIAKVIDTNKPFSIFVSVALLKLFNQFSNELYMEYLINSPYVRTLSQENTTGVANKNLVIKSINNFLIPLPPLEEQERIVEILNAIDNAIDNATKVEEDNKKLLNSLLDKFLNEKN